MDSTDVGSDKSIFYVLIISLIILGVIIFLVVFFNAFNNSNSGSSNAAPTSTDEVEPNDFNEILKNKLRTSENASGSDTVSVGASDVVASDTSKNNNSKNNSPTSDDTSIMTNSNTGANTPPRIESLKPHIASKVPSTRSASDSVLNPTSLSSDFSPLTDDLTLELSESTRRSNR